MLRPGVSGLSELHHWLGWWFVTATGGWGLGFHRVGGGWKVMGLFVFPLRSWEVVLGFTLFGREWREQRFFWIEHYSASLCRCWNRTNERELEMSMCADWVFSCCPFFCQSIFSRNLIKHGPIDRTWDPTGFQEEKGLAWILSALAVRLTCFLLGSSWGQLLEANHICHGPKKRNWQCLVSYERWGMPKNDAFKTGFGGEL